MSQPSTIPQQLMTAALLHFEQGVPIDDCACRTEHKRRLARVDHVYWVWKRNPFLDYFQMFKQLVRGKYADAPSEHHAAQKDRDLFEFIIAQVAPTPRRVSEERVRAAANHLMRIGMETDNGFNIAEGAKIAMRLDRLDEPEDERADMSKVAFLPSVVVTDIRQVDDTKENIDDEETKRIIAKYGAYVDEKHQAIDDEVDRIEARSQAKRLERLTGKEEDYEQDRDEPERQQ